MTAAMPAEMSPKPVDATSETARGSRFAALTTAWALCALVTSFSFLLDMRAMLVAVLAVGVLIMPENVPLFLVLSTVTIVKIFLHLPLGPNHYLLEMFAALAFVGTAIPYLFKKGVPNVKAELLDRAAPTARLLMIIVYFFAVLDKLNYDYFSPHGCGWELLSPFLGGDATAAKFPFIWQISVFGSVTMEALLMIGLATKRFRKQTIIAGALFHSFLAVVPYEGIASFSSITLTLYILFIPLSYFEDWQILPKLKQLPTRAAAIIGIALVYGGMGFFLSRAMAHSLYPRLSTFGAIEGEPDLAAIFFSAIVFIPMGLWFIGNVVRTMPKFEKPTVDLWRKGWIAVIPVLAILNGLCPYLGLKTQTSFAMFSNIRTEQKQFNHFFMPPAMQIFDFQKEVITVTKYPSDFSPGTGTVDLVPFEFRRRVMKMKNGGTIRFIRNGRLGSVTKGVHSDTNEDLLKPIPFWQAKLLRFRPVIDGPIPCRH